MNSLEISRNKRIEMLYSIKLKFDGQQFSYEDINFHWTDIVCMSDDEFLKAYEGAKNRKEQIDSKLKIILQKQGAEQLIKIVKEKGSIKILRDSDLCNQFLAYLQTNNIHYSAIYKGTYVKITDISK